MPHKYNTYLSIGRHWVTYTNNHMSHINNLMLSVVYHFIWHYLKKDVDLCFHMFTMNINNRQTQA